MGVGRSYPCSLSALRIGSIMLRDSNFIIFGFVPSLKNDLLKNTVIAGVAYEI
jgi:hypothetical protein